MVVVAYSSSSRHHPAARQVPAHCMLSNDRLLNAPPQTSNLLDSRHCPESKPSGLARQIVVISRADTAAGRLSVGLGSIRTLVFLFCGSTFFFAFVSSKHESTNPAIDLKTEKLITTY